MIPIPFIRVAGSHAEAGRQIGAACRAQLGRALDKAATWLPDGIRWDDMRQAAAPYLSATFGALPGVVAELEGAASGAGVEVIDLVVLGTEEIWRHPPSGRCSDFAAGPP